MIRAYDDYGNIVENYERDIMVETLGNFMHEAYITLRDNADMCGYLTYGDLMDIRDKIVIGYNNREQK